MDQSTSIFMSELNEQTIRIALLALFGSMTLLLLCACLYMLVRCLWLREQRWGTRFCAHCGNSLPPEPAHGIALADKSYLVYNCPKCKGETILSQ